MKNKTLWILAAGLAAASLLHAEPEKKGPRGFKAADADGDGFVSQSELVAFRTEAAKRMAAEKGGEFDEKRAAGMQKRLEKAFAEADANRDGQLDAAEFAAMAKRGPGEGNKQNDS